jgi:Metallo-peptidase family M12B Reprolysin-like
MMVSIPRAWARRLAALVLAGAAILGPTGCLFSSKTAVSEKKAAKAIPVFMGQSAVDEDTLYEYASGNEFSARGQLNPTILDAKASPLRYPGSRLLFNLFADRQFIAIVDEVEDRSGDHFISSGHIEGAEDAQFYLTYYHGRLSGAIHAAAEGTYRITQVEDRLYRAARMNNFDPPVLHVDSSGSIGRDHFSPENLQKLGITDATNRMRYLDIAVYYDSSALTAAGSHAAIKAEIAAAVDEMNVALKNSKVKVMYNLVDNQMVAYRGSNSLQTDLSRLRNSSDGQMDTLHILRGLTGADLVSVIVGQGTDAAGIAYLMGSLSTGYASQAFSVSHRSYIQPGFLTFAHEIGHNMGCHHDYSATGGSPGLFDYSHGFIFTGKDKVGYKTILAYGGNKRIPYYSSPKLKYAKVTIGNKTQADNARTIDLAANVIELYNTRSSVAATFISPTAGETVTSRSAMATFTINKEALVDSLVVRNIFNGTDNVLKTLRKKPWRVPLNKLPNGNHKLYTQIVDKGRNRNTGDTISFVINFTAKDGMGDEDLVGETNEQSQAALLPGASGDTVRLISADGRNPAHDAMPFYGRDLPLNVKIAATLKHISGRTGMAQAGILVRDSLDGGSPATFLSLGWDDSLRLGSRKSPGAAMVVKPFRGSYPGERRLMLVRRGRSLAGYASDGLSWIYLGKAIGSGNLRVIGGLAMVSHAADLADTAYFTDMRIDSLANYPPTLAVTGIQAGGVYDAGASLTAAITVGDLDGIAQIRGVKAFALTEGADGAISTKTLLGEDLTRPYAVTLNLPSGSTALHFVAYDALDSSEVVYPLITR